MHDDVAVTVVVNGASSTLADDGGVLLFALREQLGLLGVRPGCGVGECGACTVLIDGEPTTSCTTTLGAVNGRRITTPEGLGTPDDPHAVQRAFLESQAAQCGYCVNGVIMRVAAFTAEDRTIGDDELLAALDGHICRCGTHPRIIQAARRAIDGTQAPGTERPEMLCTERSTCEVRRCSAVAASEDSMPPEIARAPNVEDWLGILDDGRVLLRSGRSEIGQGVHNAMGQIAAAQLGIDHDDVVVASATTANSPDEDYTVRSVSIPQGGWAVGMAAMAFRRLIIARAAEPLDVPTEHLAIEPPGIVRARGGSGVTFADLCVDGPLTGRIDSSDQPRWDLPPLGTSPVRADLGAKLTGGGAYVHDLHLPGMLHARALLPPNYEAVLDHLDTAGVERLPGVVTLVRDGRIVIVVAEREEQAIRGVAALEARARWSDPGLPFDGDVHATMRNLPTHPHVVRADPDAYPSHTDADARDTHTATLEGGRELRASYTSAYQAHASMAPSCAVALAESGHLHVWSATQGVYPFRRELAMLLGEDPEDITVTHVHGPGAYGHNGADDVSALAAIAARAVQGRPVRLQYSVADEFRWDAYGPAMVGELGASLDGDGHIRAWRHHTWTDAHTARARGQGNALLPSWLRADAPRPRLWAGPGEGGARNLVPGLYDIDHVDAVADHVDTPLRTGSLRSLGAFANVFAAESFVDELAELAGRDPVEFRRLHLRDRRARAVLDAAVEAAGWRTRVGPSGGGQGLCVMRYHDVAAYVALVAEVHVDLDEDVLRVDRLVLAADAGTIVNPEGLRQQLEGGLVQGVSRTLKESVRADRRGIQSLGWSTYPVIGFREVPAIEIVLLHRPGAPPLGAGEVATPAVPAAVANAIDDAVGIRLRRIPFTAAAVGDHLLTMDDAALGRVLSG